MKIINIAIFFVEVYLFVSAGYNFALKSLMGIIYFVFGLIVAFILGTWIYNDGKNTTQNRS